jgi:hypothetical protein
MFLRVNLVHVVLVVLVVINWCEHCAGCSIIEKVLKFGFDDRLIEVRRSTNVLNGFREDRRECEKTVR